MISFDYNPGGESLNVKRKVFNGLSFLYNIEFQAYFTLIN